jgi:hypothetical protein
MNAAPEAQASNSAGDLSAFLAWLRVSGGEDGRYVLARFSTRSRYQMTGHAWSAFHGTGAFLSANPDRAASLAGSTYVPRLFWSERPELRRRFAAFVREEGHRFPGQDGGAWAAKLPRSLGGTQAEGGAGSGLVARMLILLARYNAEPASELQSLRSRPE